MGLGGLGRRWKNAGKSTAAHLGGLTRQLKALEVAIVRLLLAMHCSGRLP